MNKNVFIVRKEDSYITNFKRSIKYSMKSFRCSLYFLINAFAPMSFSRKATIGIQELQYQIEYENLNESQIMIYEEIL
jgi:hypothetical protein